MAKLGRTAYPESMSVRTRRLILITCGLVCAAVGGVWALTYRGPGSVAWGVLALIWFVRAAMVRA